MTYELSTLSSCLFTSSYGTLRSETIGLPFFLSMYNSFQSLSLPQSLSLLCLSCTSICSFTFPTALFFSSFLFLLLRYFSISCFMSFMSFKWHILNCSAAKNSSCISLSRGSSVCIIGSASFN